MSPALVMEEGGQWQEFQFPMPLADSSWIGVDTYLKCSISNWKCSISTWNLAMGFGCDYSSWNYQYSRANPERFKAELIGYWNEAARIMYACMVSTEWFGLDLLPPVCFLNIASNSAPSVLLLFKRNTKNHQIWAFCRNTSNFCCFCQIPPTFQKQPTTRSV